MRKRILRLADDEYDTPAPQVKVSSPRISEEISAGKPAEGTFTLTSENGVTLRGQVYSSNPYVIFDEPQFEGEECTLTWQIKADGTVSGEVLEGIFTIVGNQFQLEIPYAFTYVDAPLTSSEGRITSLSDFTGLARRSWTEALKLFFTDEFAHMMDREEPHRALLYRAYRRGMLSFANLEAFLVASGAKEAVACRIDESTREYEYLWEARKQSIEITRSGWGFVLLQAKAEGDFIQLKRTEIGPESFLGDKSEIEYVLDPEKMHLGNNDGRIMISGCGRQYRIDIHASAGSLHDTTPSMETMRRKLAVRITRTWIGYSLGQMTRTEFSRKWLRDLEDIAAIDPTNEEWYRLLRAMAMIETDDLREAREIVNLMRGTVADHDSALWAFVLYLQILMENPNSGDISSLISEMETIYASHQADIRILWMLIRLRSQASENTERCFEDIRRRMAEGSRSPLLITEAVRIIRNNPYFLVELDDFTVYLLSWMARHLCFTEEISRQIARILTREKVFRENVYRIAAACAKEYPEEDMIRALTGYMLLGGLNGQKYLPWYERAIEMDVPAAGLYEAYIMSLSDASVAMIPEIVTEFFRFQNTLPADKTALLYANVIIYKDRNRDAYVTYQPIIDNYAMQMMQKGRIDDNLAMIYADFLSRCEITEEISRLMAPLLFVHKVACFQPEMQRVIVWQSQLEDPTIAFIHHGIAYVPLHSDEYVAVFEDNAGVLTADEKICHIEPLMDIRKWYPLLSQAAPDALGYLLHGAVNPMACGRSLVNTACAEHLLTSRRIRRDFREACYPAILKVLADHGRSDIAESYFQSLSDLKGLGTFARSCIISSWIDKGQYHKAFLMLRRYPGLGVSSQSLLSMCAHLIDSNGMDWADDFILSLLGWLVREIEPDPPLPEYLSLHYIGPTEEMVHLWEILKKRNQGSSGLEARIIVQELFTEHFCDLSSEIFEDYRSHGANRLVSEAYINYWCHRYMLASSKEEEKIPAHIFAYVFDANHKNRPLSDSARCALLKRFATASSLTTVEYDDLTALLEQALSSHRYFAFYRQMDAGLLNRFMLYDLYYISYVGTAHQKLSLSWNFGDGRSYEAPMKEMYGGIYVRPFVLFTGQSVHYQITLSADTETVIYKGELKADRRDASPAGGYHRLNGMEESLAREDQKTLKAQMKQYLSDLEIAKQIFPSL